MKKLTRNNRLVVISKTFVESPNKIIGLNKFSEMLNASKSTISEDIVIVREILEEFDIGKVQTISGATGGMKFIPKLNKDEIDTLMDILTNLLLDEERVVAGNFIYLTDIVYNSSIISKCGTILASCFENLNVDCIVTVETKGIPLAYEVAKNLGVELVIIRKENKVTEGPSVSINYVSGSSGRIQQMTLAKKAMKLNSKCIFIDDFLRAGGTAQGIKNLLKEFDSELLGTGVLIDNVAIKNKSIDEYVAIIDLDYDDINRKLSIKKSKYLK